MAKPGRMRRRLAGCAAVLLAAAAAGGASAGGQSNDGDAVGLDDLLARLGAANLPVGAGVVVGQVEAPDGQGDYAPDQGLDEFSGKTFVEASGASGVSGHASNVGRNFYGNTISIAPALGAPVDGEDVPIHLFEALDWIGPGLLFANSANLPAPPPAGLRIFSNSWLGAFTFPNQNNNVLRRADSVVVRDDLIIVAGMDNDEPGNAGDGTNPPLMSHVFNGLAVGVADGTHTGAATASGIDGPGRMKPEIVAPGTKTSWATPVVAAGAALLVETARLLPAEGATAAAERSEVVKAALLAGADHRPGWTNNPVASGPDRGVTAQPLDALFGADLLDVNVSHLILTSGRQAGAAAPPDGPTVLPAGWDLVTTDPGASRYWRMSVCADAAEASLLATWHRRAEFPFSGADWSVADFDLILWRVDAEGGLATLVGDPGLPFFGGGNVVSESAVDNIEHLFVTDLAAGDYVLELRRVDGLTDPWDAAVAWHLPDPLITGDLDGDCTVGVLDFLALLAAWGPCPEPCPVVPCPADLDGDCAVGVTDFLELLANWS